MKILSNVISKIKTVFVMGELENEEEIAEFFTYLADSDVSEIRITFFDARMLPGPFIERLAQSLENAHDVKIKVSVLQRYLHSYLLRLGIKNVFLEQKSLESSENKKINVIAIGGSANSLDKIFRLISSLPVADVAIFIVQHIREDAPNLLPQLLAGKTNYKVLIPVDGEKVTEGKIYVAPPGLHLSVENGAIRLSEEAPVCYARPSIEVLFRSLAAEYRDRLCAILLCGYGTDGIGALQSLRSNGARIIIEDPEECEAKDLPQNALKTGYFDKKLGIDKVAVYLKESIEDIALDEAELVVFLGEIYEKYGYDYRNYNLDSIMRRVKVSMARAGSPNFRKFRREVLKNPNMFEELFLEFSINVTEFFRDFPTFQLIKTKILPYLNTYPHIKIWCAGCSTGEEPYSLAMMLDEMGMLNKSLIYATDINPYVIGEAKNGLYNYQKVKASAENYLKAGGEKRLENYFEMKGCFAQIERRLQEKILFFQHSLIDSGVLNEFQLIMCRNVLIYFDGQLQAKVLSTFQNSLDLSGFLILGKSEEISPGIKDKYFRVYDKENRIYKKVINACSDGKRG